MSDGTLMPTKCDEQAPVRISIPSPHVSALPSVRGWLRLARVDLARAMLRNQFDSDPNGTLLAGESYHRSEGEGKKKDLDVRVCDPDVFSMGIIQSVDH